MDLLYQFHLIQAIRNFFYQEGFLDVLTPPMVQNPGMEPHIHPFSLYSPSKKKLTQSYLHTSPEFHMKQLISKGFEKIFTISYCFRDEPVSPIHRNQFLMLEWYRSHERYERIMDDIENLIIYCHNFLLDKKIPLKIDINQLSFERYTIQELFKDYINIDILNFLEISELRRLIEKNFPDIPLPAKDKMLWEDYYFLLFLNRIEPQLIQRPYLLLYEFPKDLCALSTIKKEDPRVCERFEVYLSGIELCNCYNELTDLKKQRERIHEQQQLKKFLYNYELPEPNILVEALEKGLPPSSGIALGVERLLLSLIDIENPFYDSINQ